MAERIIGSEGRNFRRLRNRLFGATAVGGGVAAALLAPHGAPVSPAEIGSPTGSQTVQLDSARTSTPFEATVNGRRVTPNPNSVFGLGGLVDNLARDGAHYVADQTLSTFGVRNTLGEQPSLVAVSVQIPTGEKLEEERAAGDITANEKVGFYYPGDTIPSLTAELDIEAERVLGGEQVTFTEKEGWFENAKGQAITQGKALGQRLSPRALGSAMRDTFLGGRVRLEDRQVSPTGATAESELFVNDQQVRGHGTFTLATDGGATATTQQGFTIPLSALRPVEHALAGTEAK